MVKKIDFSFFEIGNYLVLFAFYFSFFDQNHNILRLISDET